ncbi:MAG: hypothetical protein IPL75_21660 [Acidobacteria bacterium]|nr:hypothetical protein [Acidobacteriota bacterium]
MLSPVATGQIAKAVVTQTGVTAIDDRGAEMWRHTFPADHLTLLSESVAEPTQVMRSAPSGVYALTSYVVRRPDSTPGPGTLWFAPHAYRPRGRNNLGTMSGVNTEAG